MHKSHLTSFQAAFRVGSQKNSDSDHLLTFTTLHTVSYSWSGSRNLGNLKLGDYCRFTYSSKKKKIPYAIYPAFHNGNILQNYSTISQPGY